MVTRRWSPPGRSQFSVLVAVVVTSAVLPTILAQRIFHPRHVFEAMGSETDPELLEAQSRPLDSPGTPS